VASGNFDECSVTSCEADTESNCSVDECPSADVSPKSLLLLQKLHVTPASVPSSSMTVPTSSDTSRKSDRVVTAISTDSYDLMAVGSPDEEDACLFDIDMDISPRFAQMGLSAGSSHSYLNSSSDNNDRPLYLNDSRRTLSSLVMSPKQSPLYKKRRSGSVFNRRSSFFASDDVNTETLSEDDIDLLMGICIPTN